MHLSFIVTHVHSSLQFQVFFILVEFPERIRLIITGKVLNYKTCCGVGGTYILQDEKHNGKPYYVHQSGAWSISWRTDTKSWNIGSKSISIDNGRNLGYVIGPSNDERVPINIKSGWRYSDDGWQNAADNEVQFEVISSSEFLHPI